jgi:hypothetical protein
MVVIAAKRDRDEHDGSGSADQSQYCAALLEGPARGSHFPQHVVEDLVLLDPRKAIPSRKKAGNQILRVHGSLRA